MKKSIYMSKEEYNNYYREYRKTHKEAVKKARKRYIAKFKKKHGFHPNRRFPEKVRARKALVEAVKAGKIKRLNCLVCGESNSHAHHDNYDKPLEVKWFCPLHHSEYHKYFYKPTRVYKVRTKRNPFNMTKAQLKFFKEKGKLGGLKLLKERGTEYFSKISKMKTKDEQPLQNHSKDNK